MRKLFYGLTFSMLLLSMACNSNETEGDSKSPESEYSIDSDGATESSGTSSEGSTSGGTPQSQSGLITAAEWNDLDNWPFWTDILTQDDYNGFQAYWSFYTDNRFAILLQNNTGAPVADIPVVLQRNGTDVWHAKTDNLGRAELFAGVQQLQQLGDVNEYSLLVNGELSATKLTAVNDGVNEITYTGAVGTSNKVEVSFIVDATGSMSDELEFLKKDLQEVIQRVEANLANIAIETSTVFYRDEGDQYVVKHSDFTSDINTTLSFINEQYADGGGDFPEAVHTALRTAVDDLQWANQAKTRIAFLLLDAPPHHEQKVITQLQEDIAKAAKMGIKIIPITASGIDKETEFLMRFLAISTNGTYVFITNDSGIGGDHIEASVGQHEIEKLNDLLVRLITKYSE